jgi:excisionase family DNA binding protein
VTVVHDTTVSLNEAAEQLGVHYMTAYRYVRTGRLRADRVDGRWRIDGADLWALEHREPAVPGTPIPLGERQSRLHARMVAGDEPGAWQVLEDAMTSGLEPAQIHTELLVPVMARLGDECAGGTVSVADEHRAIVVASRLVGRLGPRFARRGRTWGTVVVGMCTGDGHGLASAILADLLRGEHFLVVDLGADTPVEAFVEASLGADRLVAVLIGVSDSGLDAVVAETVRALHDAGCPVPVMVGGAAIGDEWHSRRLGADGWSGQDAASAVQALLATGDDAEALSV